MPLQLNLLHEEISEQRQRQRDPLKISVLLAIAITAVLVLNYLWGGYQLLGLKAKLSAAEHDWAATEPKVTAAKTRAEELNGVINATRVLDEKIEQRFFWAPMLEKISRSVPPNLQLTALEGIADEEKNVTVNIEGTAGGREPRAVAEDFRQLLLEQLGKDKHEIKVEFKSLEDLEATVNVGGSNVATARFMLVLSFNPYSSKEEKPAPTDHRKGKKGAAKEE